MSMYYTAALLAEFYCLTMLYMQTELFKKSALEKAEENDLMRFIENGHTVHAVLSPYKTVSVDTPKDVDIVCDVLRQRQSR